MNNGYYKLGVMMMEQLDHIWNFSLVIFCLVILTMLYTQIESAVASSFELLSYTQELGCQLEKARNILLQYENLDTVFDVSRQSTNNSTEFANSKIYFPHFLKAVSELTSAAMYFEKLLTRVEFLRSKKYFAMISMKPIPLINDLNAKYMVSKLTAKVAELKMMDKSIPVDGDELRLEFENYAKDLKEETVKAVAVLLKYKDLSKIFSRPGPLDEDDGVRQNGPGRAPAAQNDGSHSLNYDSTYVQMYGRALHELKFSSVCLQKLLDRIKDIRMRASSSSVSLRSVLEPETERDAEIVVAEIAAKESEIKSVECLESRCVDAEELRIEFQMYAEKLKSATSRAKSTLLKYENVHDIFYGTRIEMVRTGMCNYESQSVPDRKPASEYRTAFYELTSSCGCIEKLLVRIKDLKIRAGFGGVTFKDLLDSETELNAEEAIVEMLAKMEEMRAVERGLFAGALKEIRTVCDDMATFVLHYTEGDLIVEDSPSRIQICP